MKRIATIALIAALAGCGVDGEPVRPSVSTTVHASNNGVGVGTSVGADLGGGVSVGVGLGL